MGFGRVTRPSAVAGGAAAADRRLRAISAAVVLSRWSWSGCCCAATGDGVEFRVADQVGLIGVGVLIAAGIMTAARPRLRVDATGLWVRNVLGEAFFPGR